MAEQKAAEAARSDEKKKNTEEKTVGSQDVNNVLTLLPKIMASITAENQETLLKDVFSHVDIVGYNYGELWYEKTHEMVPERVMLSSETFPCRIGSNWKRVAESPYLIGDFMWTAWDYLGEAGVGLPFYGSTQAPFSKDYPCLTAGCGSVDLTGYVESQGYYSSIVYGTYPETTEKFSDSSYTSYHGRLLAIVQSNGEQGVIKVTASAEGVETETVEVMAY